MEAASEKKRGRPVERGFARDPVVRRLWSGTMRHTQDKVLANDAIRHLGLTPLEKADPADVRGFHWLVDWEAGNAKKRGAIKWSVLTELGRYAEVYGGEAMREVASILCDMTPPPSVKEAAAIVRRARLGRDPAGSTDDLGRVLLRAVNDYRALHPQLSLAETAEAVGKLLETIRRDIQRRQREASLTPPEPPASARRDRGDRPI